MLRFRLSDLKGDLRRQAERQLAPQSDTRTAASLLPKAVLSESPYSPTKVERPPAKDHRGTPNATEREYNEKFLGGMGRYEPVILRLPGGNYTPDFMTIDDGTVTFHEVKGAYRFGSESRAVLAFLSAAAAFPFWRFVWAQKKKGGWVVRRASEADASLQKSGGANG